MVVDTGAAGDEAIDVLLKYELLLPAVPAVLVLEPGLHFDME